LITGAEWSDGSWWKGWEEEASLVCFAQGEEGEEVAVDIDDLKVVRCGTCRVIGNVITVRD
jgi:hypothetical protein